MHGRRQELTLRGRLIGSRTALGRGGGIVVYLHQIGLSSQYWNFKAVPGYDFAGELARRGHVSLVLDQLGYGASSRADGTQVCYGSEADMASQIAGRLKKGDYDAGGGQAARFSRVALGSNGAGGFMVQPAAYSTGNVDALVVTGWADQGYSQTSSRERPTKTRRALRAVSPRTGSRATSTPRLRTSTSRRVLLRRRRSARGQRRQGPACAWAVR